MCLWDNIKTASILCCQEKHHHVFMMPLSSLLVSLLYKHNGKLRKDLGLAWLISISGNKQKPWITDTSYAKMLEQMAYFDGFVCIFVSESQQCDLLRFGRFALCYSHKFWLTQLICETNSKLTEILSSNSAIHYSSIKKKKKPVLSDLN